MTIRAEYTFREVTRAEEFRELYTQLRTTYLETPGLCRIVPQDDSLFMVDEFDLVSRQWAWFERTAFGERIVGGHRIVCDSLSQHDEAIRTAVSDDPIALGHLDEPRTAPLPIAAHSVHGARVLEFMEHRRAKGWSFIEAGRHFLLPQVRDGRAEDGLHLDGRQCATLIAKYVSGGERTIGITGYRSRQGPYFARFGILVIDGCEPAPDPAGGGLSGVVGYVEPATMPPAMLEYCRRISAILRVRGELRLEDAPPPPLETAVRAESRAA